MQILLGHQRYCSSDNWIISVFETNPSSATENSLILSQWRHAPSYRLNRKSAVKYYHQIWPICILIFLNSHIKMAISINVSTMWRITERLNSKLNSEISTGLPLLSQLGGFPGNMTWSNLIFLKVSLNFSQCLLCCYWHYHKSMGYLLLVFAVSTQI